MTKQLDNESNNGYVERLEEEHRYLHSQLIKIAKLSSKQSKGALEKIHQLSSVIENKVGELIPKDKVKKSTILTVGQRVISDFLGAGEIISIKGSGNDDYSCVMVLFDKTPPIQYNMGENPTLMFLYNLAPEE